MDRVAAVDSRGVSEILSTTDCVVLLQYTVSASRVPTVRENWKMLGIFCCQGNVRENVIFENSGKMILDHADCR